MTVTPSLHMIVLIVWYRQVPVIVGICDDDVVLRVDGDPAGLRELSLQDPELTELAVVDHLLALYLDSEYQFRTAALVKKEEKRD